MDAQRKGPTRRNFALIAVFAVLASGGVRAADWIGSEKSQARLVDGGSVDGARYAGAQIRLSGEAVTYWRDPGEAGVPPSFDFSDSDNLAEAVPLYPPPERFEEAGAQVFGYRHQTLFPIRVTPKDKSRPVVLSLKLDYAACEKICLPVHAEMSVTLPPRGESPDAPLVAEAVKRLPRGVSASEMAEIAPLAPVDGKPQWRLRLKRGPARDLFVEAPHGFYIESKPEDAGAYLLTLVEHPSAQTLPVDPAHVTLTGAAPVEFELPLPTAK